jgi:erythromycin esterase
MTSVLLETELRLGKLRTKQGVLWGVLVVALACGGSETAPSGSHAVIEWVSTHAVAVDRLDFSAPVAGFEGLRSSIGSARLVGLGESRHDTREQLILKGMLVRYLVENLGFRTLILEESVPHAESLDRYVRSGEGDLRDLMNGLAGWYLWDTEEMLEVIRWIRDFNADREPDQHVRIFGVDITAPALGVESVLETLEIAGADAGVDARALGLDLQQGDFWPTTWERYAALSDERRQELGDNYDELISVVTAQRTRIVASLSEEAYERALWMAEIGRAGNALFSSASREEGGAIRERGMAQATLRILDREIPGDKAILWAHNLHVATSSFRMPGLAEGALEPMGVQLREELGDAYIAIGGTFGSGTYPADLPPGGRVFEVASEDVMDGALAGVDLPFFMLDLHGVEQNPAAAKWLQQDREWIAQDSRAVLVPSAAFDLVYYVHEISRSQPTPLALQRFQTLGR